MTTEFPKGSEVEVSSNEEGFRGSWYTGSVVRGVTPRGGVPHKKKVMVQYHTLTKANRPLRETLDPLHLRPALPTENRTIFHFSQEVDAWFNDGWWEGVITKVLEGSNRYKVFFRGTREEIEFGYSELRLHREWYYGTWVPPFEHPHDGGNENLGSSKVSSADEINAPKESKFVFDEEMVVEVSSDEDGFQGAWFTATIIKRLIGDRYKIEYKSLRTDDDTEFLQEEADALHIRPYPPDTIMVDSFNLHEEVDALYQDGWWVGVVSKVLNDGRYLIYFRDTGEEMKFNHSDLRIHQEWINGKWVIARALQQ